MTPQAALAELLNRLEASRDAAVHISAEEMREWPPEDVKALKSARLVTKARPVSRLVCPGCEKQCSKDVDVFPAEGARRARAYIHCDEPEDLGRIEIDLAALEQWRMTGEGLAGAVGRLLGFNKPPEQDCTGKHWTLGLLQGKAHKGTIKLAVDGVVALAVGGHAVALTEVLSFDASGLAVDRSELLRLVDKPAPDAQAYKPSIARRQSRKLDTQQKYAAWKKAARELRRKPQGKSERWVSLQIAKMEVAKGSCAETIRKHIRR